MADNIGERALIWLGQEGFAMEPLKEPGFVSLYRAYQPSSPKNKISLSQAVGEDKIVIASGVFLSDEDRTQMAKFPPEKRAQIVKELSKVLYGSAGAFRMEEEQGVLRGVTMTRFIFADGLNKDRFMNAVFDLYRTQALALLHLSDYLGPETGRLREAPQEPKVALATEPVGESVAKDKKEAPSPTPGLALCLKCGAQIPEGARFCSSCGASRIQPSAQPPPPAPTPTPGLILCRQCGNRLKAGTPFCTRCGQRL